LIAIAAVSLTFSCQSPTGDFTDTPTTGEVGITVDESYTLLFENQVTVFQELYPNAKINVRYKPEREALEDLINDSSKVIVTNRELTDEETKYFEQNNIFPKTIKIAEDAVALIVHPENPDSNLSVTYLKKLLTGEEQKWISNKEADVNIVFDNVNSTNFRYMKELVEGADFQKNCFAVKSNQEVIDYVSKQPNAIGIISVNWISDKDDTLSQHFLSQVRVVGLTNHDVIDPMTRFYKPYQGFVVTKEYPLVRSVFMINRQTRAGLGTGFVSFVAGDKGQRIIRLRGMVPANIPIRLIQNR
jgi:phosphate transport system substrate-binding protein